MHLIEVTPQPCMICGAGNTPSQDGTHRQFIDLERDTFWDDPAVICEDCGLKIAGLLGTPSPEELHTAHAQVREARSEIHTLRAEIDGMKRRATRLGITFLPDDEETAIEAAVA
jgi:hypothetical protein